MWTRAHAEPELPGAMEPPMPLMAEPKADILTLTLQTVIITTGTSFCDDAVS